MFVQKCTNINKIYNPFDRQKRLWYNDSAQRKGPIYNSIRPCFPAPGVIMARQRFEQLCRRVTGQSGPVPMLSQVLHLLSVRFSAEQMQCVFVRFMSSLLNKMPRYVLGDWHIFLPGSRWTPKHRVVSRVSSLYSTIYTF